LVFSCACGFSLALFHSLITAYFNDPVNYALIASTVCNSFDLSGSTVCDSFYLSGSTVCDSFDLSSDLTLVGFAPFLCFSITLTPIFYYFYTNSNSKYNMNSNKTKAKAVRE